jgi:hypothetical protein
MVSCHCTLNADINAEVLSKCITLYPEALSIPNIYHNLPIHFLLVNNSSIESALLMFESYPQALQHRNEYDQLPIFIECNYLCRPPVISRCIELYPSSLQMTDSDGRTPFSLIILHQKSSIRQYRPLLSMMLEAYPAALYTPPHKPTLNDLDIVNRPLSRRLIMNLAPSCLSSADLNDCYNLNWYPRSALIQLLRKVGTAKASSKSILRPLCCGESLWLQLISRFVDMSSIGRKAED